MAPDDTLLERLVTGAQGLGSDTSAPKRIRFLRAVIELLRKASRLSLFPENGTLPTIFLHSESGLGHSSGPRIPMFDNARSFRAGKVWYLNAVGGAAASVDVEDHDCMAMYQKAQIQLGCGDAPAVVHDPTDDPNLVRFFPSGLDHPEVAMSHRITIDPVTADEVFHQIQRFYEDNIVTPDAIKLPGHIWKDPQQRLPSNEAEREIQLVLIAFLFGAFPQCHIRSEQTSPVGRCDIQIVGRRDGPDQAIFHWVLLELKVFRSRSSTGTTTYSVSTILDQIQEGVRQAATYRDELGHLESALCCFDMRDVDDQSACFEAAKIQASTLRVKMKRWYLYSNAKDYRKKIAGG